MERRQRAGKKLLVTSLALGLMITAGSVWAAEGSGGDAVAAALKGDWGQIKLNLRYRWEHVEQD